MAGEADAERLVVLLEARLTDFERNMMKAAVISRTQWSNVRKGAKSATAQMEQDVVRSTTRINQALSTVGTKIGGMSKAFGVGLVGGIFAGGVAGIVSQLTATARGIAEIGDEAKRAGLSFTAFQELKYVAEQNRVGVDALVDGIKELNLRADEFILTGGGSAAEAFGRLGYDAETLSRKLKDPAELFTEIIGKLQQLDRAAQIRIADELFGGTGGEKFVQLIEQGEDGIRATREEAHKLGVVMSDEVIKRADELDRKFNAITTAVGSGLKTAIVEAADAMQRFINTFQGWWQDYERRRQTAELGSLAGSLAGAPGTGTLTRPPAAPSTEAPRASPSTPMPSQSDLAADFLRKYREELALTNRERAIAAEQERILSDAASKGIRVTKEQAAALAAEKVARDETEAASKKQGTERERSAKRAEVEAQKVRELIDELEEELSLVGASEQAKRAAAAAREAGAHATEEERNRVIALNEALYQAEDAERKHKDAMEDAGNIALDAVGSLTDAINTGNEALDQFLQTLILAVAQAALLGQGPLAGLFGGASIFGGPAAPIDPWAGLRGYAGGTNYAPGGMAIVGEDGPELLKLPRGSQITPNHQITNALRENAASTSMNFAPSFTIDARGAQPGVSTEIEGAIRKAMDQMRREFPMNTAKALKTIKVMGYSA